LTELGALGHRSGLSAVTDLAAFLVFGRLTKTSFVRLLVDLGATQLVAAAHYVHSCFFTTHKWAQHFVDQTVLDQGF
jgi:hypothetical protein